MPAGTEARLKELGIVLPELPTPGGNYVPAKTVGHMVYLAGVISSNAHGAIAGTLGVDRSVKSRTSYGGTAPTNVRRQAKAWLRRLGAG